MCVCGQKVITARRSLLAKFAGHWALFLAPGLSLILAWCGVGLPLAPGPLPGPFAPIVINLQGDCPNNVVRGLFKVTDASARRVHLSPPPASPTLRPTNLGPIGWAGRWAGARPGNMLTHHLHRAIWTLASPQPPNFRPNSMPSILKVNYIYPKRN